MIWLFAREGDSLTLETRYEHETRQFVLIVRRPDGSEETEHYGNADQFRTRLTSLETDLQTTRWKQMGPPVLLKDGWRIG